MPPQVLRCLSEWVSMLEEHGKLVYLGFVAAGEEIEELFGYNDNDPDLDMSCRNSIQQDICCLKKVPCLNMWLAFKQSGAGA
ncbi:hypothetical protein B0H14DRAFT_3506832 [Mycena olivaceomarginata]|nr:hypothetical protein B0H14DRAFT_3506832 [Mycena olivaceomarginata]